MDSWKLSANQICSFELKQVFLYYVEGVGGISVIWVSPKCFHWICWIQWQKYYILKRFLESVTSCVRYLDATSVTTRHMSETGSVNWDQFMIQRFTRFPEFAEFTEFLIHLGKTPLSFKPHCEFFRPFRLLKIHLHWASASTLVHADAQDQIAVAARFRVTVGALRNLQAINLRNVASDITNTLLTFSVNEPIAVMLVSFLSF